MTEQPTRRVPDRMADRLIVALDTSTLVEAREVVALLAGEVTSFKVGMSLAFARGFDDFLRWLVAAGLRVMLDAKLIDIGQTVEDAVARIADRGVAAVTVYGHRQVMDAAVRGKRGSLMSIFAVSVLTSVGDRVGAPVDSLVQMRAAQAARAGCDGIIASAADHPNVLREVAGSPGLMIATPGIRRDDEPRDDHVRFATPGDAIRLGSDFLIVGRPIVGHADCLARARSILAEMTAAKC